MPDGAPPPPPPPADAPVPPTTFYAPPARTPPLPPRPPPAHSRDGSSHTRFVLDSTDAASFREPELVADESAPFAAYAPGAHSGWQDSDTSARADWGASSTGAEWSAQDTAAWENYDASTGWGAQIAVEAADEDWGLTCPVAVSGRSAKEEARWWDPAECSRPGAGILPSALAERLHAPEHSLYAVQYTMPELKAPRESDDDRPPVSPPTVDEVAAAAPHPASYYCRAHNGWLLLHAASADPPPLARADVALPLARRRQARATCVGGKADETHHFHLHERAVDARELDPPLVRAPWEREAEAKKRRRGATLSGDAPVDVTVGADVPMEAAAEEKAEDEPLLLDLYVCCQCSFHVLASPTVLPGLVPVRDIDELLREKEASPSPGKTGQQDALVALETILNIIQNLLWRNETRTLPVTRAAFRRKLGWSAPVRHIFERLGFVISVVNGEESVSQPHPLDAPARARLLRGWIELGAVAAIYVRRYPTETAHASDNFVPSVMIESAREDYQRKIGAHRDQLPRVEDPPSDSPDVRAALRALGLTSTTCTPTLLAYAYYAQARCDPARTPDYLAAFETLRVALESASASFFPPTLAALASSLGGAAGEAAARRDRDRHRAALEMLQTTLVSERERGRWARGAEREAAALLGFGGPDAPLKLELSDADDAFVAGAWRHAVQRAWRAPAATTSISPAKLFSAFTGDKAERVPTVKEANDALRVLGEERASGELVGMWEKASKGGIQDPAAAFRAFNVEESAVDDGLLITAFEFHVQDVPGQRERLREALGVIAEYRDSARLRKFLEIGVDPGDIVPEMRRDWPRGLNQLGNTCYLNSLLQYFYTIKDLRDALAPLARAAKDEADAAAAREADAAAGASSKAAAHAREKDSEKLTDDELARHRVGGRLVTRREVARSKQFVHRLAELFAHMQADAPPAVTPSLALAKLALVTSKDEEEDAAAGRGGEPAASDGSNDTDATLVDDAPPRVVRAESPPPEIEAGSPTDSVLGKRARTPAPPGEMDVDAPAPAPAPATAAGPALPPRRAATAGDGGGMMFGKQHDVSECMDNCIFQIETALLKFGEGDADAEGDKTSLVKRLFFGKVKQRIVADAPPGSNAGRPSMHEREDLFSLLPVNVAGEGTDLYDGLSAYFSSTVELGGRAARMEVTLLAPPPVLQIQLQRAQFDRASLTPFKNQAYVRFGETLLLDRFLDAAPRDTAERGRALQRELADARERLLALDAGPHAPYAPALAGAAAFLRAHAPEGGGTLPDALAAEPARIAAERTELQARARALKDALEALWAGARSAEYELTSVFIHRGSSPSFGHYFFYSRNLPGAPDEWFKYNDAEVQLVGKDEVLRDTTGSTANPYMLVYVRKGANIIDTVDRIDDSPEGMDTK